MLHLIRDRAEHRDRRCLPTHRQLRVPHRQPRERRANCVATRSSAGIDTSSRRRSGHDLAPPFCDTLTFWSTLRRATAPPHLKRWWWRRMSRHFALQLRHFGCQGGATGGSYGVGSILWKPDLRRSSFAWARGHFRRDSRCRLPPRTQLQRERVSPRGRCASGRIHS
jgi:hypothetical protein